MLLKFTILTWNMQADKNQIDLKKLFKQELNSNHFQSNHMYVIYLQEARSVLDTVTNCFKNNNYDKLVECFKKKNYDLVYSKSYGTIETYIFINEKYAKLFVTSTYETFKYAVRIFPKLYKTKGVIATRMNVQNKSILLLNVHLTPHKENYQKRIEDIEMIFHVIAKHLGNFEMFDYIFFGGDLNFRLGCSAEKVKKLLENKPIKFIIKKYDQLNRFKRESSLLCDFKEKSINFMPTFKYKPNSSTFVTKRGLGYTDRILYQISSSSNDNYIEYQSYKSLDNVQQSDHKPVQAIFTIKI